MRWERPRRAGSQRELLTSLSRPPDPADCLRHVHLQEPGQCLDEVEIRCAITSCSGCHQVWTIDLSSVDQRPLSRARASLCVQDWKARQARSVGHRVVIVPREIFSSRIIPRIVVDIVWHVGVKTDEDAAWRVRHPRIAVYRCWTISIAARAEIASKTAQVLDDNPMCVSNSSSLVYPILIMLAEQCYVSIEIRRLV